MEKIEDQNEQNICNCLYDAIINGKEECFFEQNYIKKIKNKSYNVKHKLNLRAEMLQYNEYWRSYEFLVLFNNEQLEWEEQIYYRIYRYVFDRGYYANLKPLGKYGIYLYTTGITNLINAETFILMLDRAVLTQSACPIGMDDIRDEIRHANQALHSRIPSELFSQIQSQ